MWKRAKPTTIISGCVGIAGYLLERGLDMAGITLSLGWAVVLWVISGIFILFAVIVGFNAYIWPALRTIRIIRRKDGKISEAKTESGVIEKREALDSNLSITTADIFTRVHTCSQCGWGFRVLTTTLGKSVITCPKCGNVENNTRR